MTAYILARSAGFCFGVERSIRIAREALEKGPCWSYGELIHNDDIVRELAESGLNVACSVNDVPPGQRVILRAHGVGREELDALSARGEVIDATCPLVERIHSIVRDASESGRTVWIIGDEEHPEVRGIRGWCGSSAVFSGLDELRRRLDERGEVVGDPVTVVFQTTSIRETKAPVEELIKKRCTNAQIFDTICGATSKRQEEAVRLSRRCDCMIVIGGEHSANSRHLAELCSRYCGSVRFIAGAAELDTDSLRRYGTIGITAGASVPARIIKEVVKKMCDEIKVEEIKAEEAAAETKAEEAPAEDVANVAAEEAAAPAETAPEGEPREKSFDEMLEDSIRTINNGDMVSGYVVSITPTEVTVDLGIKHSGYIPVAEFIGDGSIKIEDVIHVGDLVEACAVRVNDVEGTVMLSKKRLDSIKSWADIERAQADETVVEGKVTEENKGGVVVNVRGIRVFVPASQTDLPRDASMSELVGKTVRLKITELNRGRKRVVGSIRDVARKERRERADQIWNEIEVGKHYNGTVKSMTSYGAFVDIGGIDGMVHVSEISWSRINKPADVLKVGDQIDVYVIGFDKENRKISLGHRDPDQNPWKIFTDTYSVGDVAKVRIVKLMDFGAFAEIVPGVDGLIHISQIANRRIGKPSEVLTVGDVVDVSITNIDNEKKKVSLSIRALSEPAPAPAPAREEAADAEGDAVVYSIDADGQPTGEAPAEE